MAGKGKFGKFIEGKARGALEGLTDVFGKSPDASYDKSRRSFLKGAGSALGVGALAGIKVGKNLIDDIPVPARKEIAKGAEGIVKKSFDLIADAFSEKMNKTGGELFGEAISTNSLLPKISDLKSFRNTNQFQQIKENVRPEIESKMSEGFGAKVNLSENAIDSQVAEIFDLDVYGDMPSGDVWSDFSPKEISDMVEELKANKNLPSEYIPEYFSRMGGATMSEASDGTPVIDLVEEFLRKN
tara:strand:+ start:89 stop:814 length:726 start_codon:yes stop_codon:yes gene_type:complete